MPFFSRSLINRTPAGRPPPNMETTAPPPPALERDDDDDEETQQLLKHRDPKSTGSRRRNPLTSILVQPIEWVQSLSTQLNPSFIFGIFLIYGLSHGFAGHYFKVASDFYWKDVQRINPSLVQLYSGFYYIPWILKPLWGILTDVFPIASYRRRPYFLIGGVVGAVSTFSLAFIGDLPPGVALGCMVGVRTGMAIGEVTLDACVARNSIENKVLAPDMQSLCGLCSSGGALLGYLASGVFVHKLGAQKALGLLTISPAAMALLGVVIYEKRVVRDGDGSCSAGKKWAGIEKLKGAVGDMGRSIRYPQVWKPSLFIFMSIALSISTHEGQFYWYTNPTSGPAFSQEFVGVIYAIGASASLVGVIIYQKLLKDCPFRTLIMLAQLFYGLFGMLDVFFILRWNLRLGIPDYVFVVIEECVSHVIARLRWTPMMVLSTRLCPLGMEGTFFALLMCIDSVGSLCSKWGGGFILHLFGVSRSDFANLWLVVLIRNVLRLVPLAFFFLLPHALPNDHVDHHSIQLVPLDQNTIHT